MSEPQNEYENEHETDAGPTPGPWQIRHGVVFSPEHRAGMCEIATILASTPSQQDEANANACLIAAAGTAAQEAKEMGYDPQRAVEALPKILNQIESLLQGEFEHEGVIFPRITDLLRELGGEPLEKDALASAEGNGDE